MFMLCSTVNREGSIHLPWRRNIRVPLKPRYTYTRLNVNTSWRQWYSLFYGATGKDYSFCINLISQNKFQQRYPNLLNLANSVNSLHTHTGLWEFWWRIKLWDDELRCLIHRHVRNNVSESLVCRQYVPPNGRYPRIKRHSFITQSTTIHKFTQNNKMTMWTGIINTNLYFYFCVIKFIQIISIISDHISQKHGNSQLIMWQNNTLFSTSMPYTLVPCVNTTRYYGMLNTWHIR